MAFSATSTTEGTVPHTHIRARFAPPAADAPVTRPDFAACIDRCVRALIAAETAPMPQESLTRLRLWMKDGTATLADGTPINLALFDDAILSVGERISRTGARNPAQLLRATRRLAESIYAKT